MSETDVLKLLTYLDYIIGNCW